MNNINSKLLKIDSNTYKNLTYNDIITQYEPLIKSIISTWSKFDREEIRQLCYIGLWKAFKAYKVDKNISFGFYAKRIILNDIYQLGSESKKHFCLSLNTPVSGTYDMEIADTLYDSVNINAENNVIYNIFIKDYLQYLNSQYQELFDLYFTQGYNQKQIAKMFQLTQPAISYRLKELTNILKRCYAFDTIAKFLPNEIKKDITISYITNDLHGYIEKSSNDKLYLTIRELTDTLRRIDNIDDDTISNKAIQWLEELYSEIINYIEILEISTQKEEEPFEEITYISIHQLDFFTQII